jgi:hypothetical protein
MVVVAPNIKLASSIVKYRKEKKKTKLKTKKIIKFYCLKFFSFKKIFTTE